MAKKIIVTPLLFCHWLFQSDCWTRINKLKQLQLKLALGMKLDKDEKAMAKKLGYVSEKSILIVEGL